MARTATPQPGDVRKWDYQSDVHGGRYRLVEKLSGRGEWLAEYVEPSDEELDSVMSDPYYSRQPDGQARMEEEALRRIADTGRRFRIRLVSHAEFSRAF